MTRMRMVGGPADGETTEVGSGWVHVPVYDRSAWHPQRVSDTGRMCEDRSCGDFGHYLYTAVYQCNRDGVATFVRWEPEDPQCFIGSGSNRRCGREL